MKDTGNAVLSNFGFKTTGSKGNKVPKFPVNNSGRTCNPLHPVRQLNMSEKEAISELVVVIPYKSDGK